MMEKYWKRKFFFFYIYINYIHKIIGIMVQIDHCLTGLKSYKKLAGVGQSVLKRYAMRA